jgi:heme A synthase
VGGSLVRATGAGDGCGDSWPRCQGSLFPLEGGTETAIEFAHRAATAALGIVLLWFVFAAWRAGPGSAENLREFGLWRSLRAWRSPGPGRELRRALGWVGIFFSGEVLIGAVLVLAGWVDTDASIGRTVVVPLHLVNTFLLVGAVVLVVHLANGGVWPNYDGRRRSNQLGLVIVGIMLLIAASGGLNALADTLFPPDTLLEGIREEFGPTAPFLVRLRILHPMLAIGGGLAVVMALRSPSFDRSGAVRGLANLAAVVVGVEAVVGLVNVALLTPVEVQLIHLLIADVLWVVAVLAVIRVLAASTEVSAQLESV